MYDIKLAKREEQAVMKRKLKLIDLMDIADIKSYWDTSHECECCGKAFCGKGAALVTIKTDEARIICSSCVSELRYAYKGANS